MAKIKRITRAVAAVIAIGGAFTVAVPAAALADPITVKSLASCTDHYANTAYWADCTGGSETSWVQLGGKCGPASWAAVWNWTDWYRVNPGQGITISDECNVRVWDADTNIRPY